jgi:hypothetical protein
VQPSARDSVAGWAKLDGCSSTTGTSGAPLDLDYVVAGAETTPERWTGCAHGAAELWTLHGVGHIPHLSTAWAPTIYGFMAAHPKP